MLIAEQLLMDYKSRLFLISIFIPHLLFSQVPQLVRVNPQHYFQRTVPKGNYSGLTWLGGDRYAVVSDKAPQSGFFIFHIQTDAVSGDLTGVRTERFCSSGETNHDEEGIAFFPKDSTLLISREADNRILEYGMDGKLTGRELSVPAVFVCATSRYGFESLTYNAVTHRFWTTSESTLATDGKQADAGNQIGNRLRLQSFDDNFQPRDQYAYLMETPEHHSSVSNYAMGVPAMAALDDGRLLVLEREFLVKPGKFGSFVINRLFCVNPALSTPASPERRLGADSPYLKKRLLAAWKTTLTLFRQNLANYEGMCLGPYLADGSRVVVLCADSQDQYGGILRDWFRTVVIR